MAPDLFIEVEVNQQPIDPYQADPGPKDEILLEQLNDYLQQEMGGLLCLNHYFLSDFTALYTKNRFVVKITSCCPAHMRQLENRLKELFRP